MAEKSGGILATLERGAVMGDNRYVVPDGMLKAVSNALAEYWRTKHIAVLEGSSVDVALAAAVQWLSEHPIVPTREEAEGIFERVFSDPPYIYGPPGDGMPGQTVNISRVQLTGRHFSKEQKVFAEWQSKMFLPREPEVPEFVACDSCRAKSGSPTLCRGCLHNREVIESFRGQRSKEQTEPDYADRILKNASSGYTPTHAELDKIWEHIFAAGHGWVPPTMRGK